MNNKMSNYVLYNVYIHHLEKECNIITRITVQEVFLAKKKELYFVDLEKAFDSSTTGGKKGIAKSGSFG